MDEPDADEHFLPFTDDDDLASFDPDAFDEGDFPDFPGDDALGDADGGFDGTDPDDADAAGRHGKDAPEGQHRGQPASPPQRRGSAPQTPAKPAARSAPPALQSPSRGRAMAQADESAMGRVFAATKSGMTGEGLPLEEQKRIVYEATKDSAFFKQQQKQDAKNTELVTALKKKVTGFTDAQLAASKKHTDALLEELEATRDLSRTIVHMDADAFYCSVEERDDPSLKSKPFAVGMTTANYVARRYGVRSGMAPFVAKALCPDIIILHQDMRKYVAASNEIKKVLLKYLSEETELSMASIDEAYLDITRYMREHNLSASAVVQKIREDVFATTGLTCSAGVAPNRSLAKVASDLRKPNGQFEVPPDRDTILQFYRALGIRKVQGIGSVNERFLREAFSIETIADIGPKLPHLFLAWGREHIGFYAGVYLGLGSNVVVQHHDTKSVSSETTFRALGQGQELLDLLRGRCEAVAGELKENNWKGRCVTLVCKRADFQRFSRQQNLLADVCEADDIFDVVRRLLEKEFRADPRLRLRLIGARVNRLSGPGTDGGAGEDDAGGVQKRIVDYAPAEQPAQPKEAVACPVCGATFEAGTADVVVSSHVNRCLDKGGEKSPAGGKRPRSGDAGRAGGKKRAPDGQRSILGFFR